MSTPKSLTRAQGIEIFEHVCAHILEVKVGSPLVLALKKAGITNIRDLMFCEPLSIERLSYVPAKSALAEPLNEGYKNLIIWFIRWVHHKVALNNGQRLTKEQWYGLEQDEFDDYRMNHGKVTTTPTVMTTSTTKTTDPVTEFKKGIKRDSSLYPTLKDQKHWNNWNRSVITQARAHDISEVFDTSYTPIPGEEALFEQKQIFAYSV